MFTGLVTIWANGAPTERGVESSLHQLARVLRLSWSGRVAELMRRSTVARISISTPHRARPPVPPRCCTTP